MAKPLPKSMRALAARLCQAQINSYRQQHATLAKEAATPTGQQRPTLFDDNNYFAFEASGKAFSLTAGRCSNHARRALDHAGDVTLSLPYPALATWLTAYGKAVLLKEGNDLPATRVFGQVLIGKLAGNTAITILHEKDDTSGISGSYFYDRIPVAFHARQADQTLELIEPIAAKSSQKQPQPSA